MFKRVYHPYDQWEEMAFNMWGSSLNKAKDLKLAIDFTGNHKLYGSFMMKVIKQWPISCENALTDSYLNKKAWVGHAAVALALRIPESITRQAWGRLSDEQQLLANREAEAAIRQWENNYRKSKQLCGGVERSLL